MVLTTTELRPLLQSHLETVGLGTGSASQSSGRPRTPWSVFAPLSQNEQGADAGFLSSNRLLLPDRVTTRGSTLEDTAITLPCLAPSPPLPHRPPRRLSARLAPWTTLSNGDRIPCWPPSSRRWEWPDLRPTGLRAWTCRHRSPTTAQTIPSRRETRLSRLDRPRTNHHLCRLCPAISLGRRRSTTRHRDLNRLTRSRSLDFDLPNTPNAQHLLSFRVH